MKRPTENMLWQTFHRHGLDPRLESYSAGGRESVTKRRYRARVITHVATVVDTGEELHAVRFGNDAAARDTALRRLLREVRDHSKVELDERALDICAWPRNRTPVAHSRHSDPATSHAAGDSLSASHLSRLEHQIIRALEYRDGFAYDIGLTGEEADRVCGTDNRSATASKRLADLKSAGLVEVLERCGDDGVPYPVTRPTSTGRAANVHVLTEDGREYLESMAVSE